MKLVLLALFSTIFFILFLPSLSFSSEQKRVSQSIGCYYYDPQKPRSSIWHNPYWVYAKEKGSYIRPKGHIEDYFFFIDDDRYSYEVLVQICKKSIPSKMKLLDIEAFNSMFEPLGYRIGFAKDNFSKFKKIVMFGDSLTDTGNLQKWPRVIPRGTIDSPYFMGRFSDGPVWIEYLSKTLKTGAFLNWSYGGMKTSDVHDVSIKDPKNKLREYGRNFVTSNLLNEIGRYFKIKTVDSDSMKSTLYAFWIGSNNYLDKVEISSTYSIIWKELEDTNYRKSVSAKKFVDLTVQDIMQGIDEIYKKGGRNFIIAGLPDMSVTPSAIKQQKEHIYYFMIVLHNLRLQEELKYYRIKKNDPSLYLHYVNTEEYMENFFNDTEKFEFKNLNSACYQGDYTGEFKGDKNENGEYSICKNPRDYVFFDLVHPTTKTHCYISWYIQQDLFGENLINIKEKSFEDQKAFCLDSHPFKE